MSLDRGWILKYSFVLTFLVRKNVSTMSMIESLLFESWFSYYKMVVFEMKYGSNTASFRIFSIFELQSFDMLLDDSLRNIVLNFLESLKSY